jgi:hypothetical protein
VGADRADALPARRRIVGGRERPGLADCSVRSAPGLPVIAEQPIHIRGWEPVVPAGVVKYGKRPSCAHRAIAVGSTPNSAATSGAVSSSRRASSEITR